MFSARTEDMRVRDSCGKTDGRLLHIPKPLDCRITAAFDWSIQQDICDVLKRFLRIEALIARDASAKSFTPCQPRTPLKRVSPPM